MAYRCKRPIAIGLCSAPSTQAPSHNSCTGHPRAQVAPSRLDSRMARAEPRKFCVAIFLMNFGISMCVGQACVHGASKHIKHRAASTAASFCVKGGRSSPSASSRERFSESSVNTSSCSFMQKKTASHGMKEGQKPRCFPLNRYSEGKNSLQQGDALFCQRALRQQEVHAA